MTYKLSITRKEPNPDYKPPENVNAIYYQKYDVPQFSVFEVLDVEVNEEQFEAIRKAALEHF